MNIDFRIRKRFDFFATICLLFFLGACTNKTETKCLPKEANIYENVEFDMPVVSEPTFAAYSSAITDFGAIADGQTDNSEAFTRAIEHVASKGGGRVVVPRGVFVTGPIVMKSNIDLHVESGAVVLFSRNMDKYPLVDASFEGLRTMRCMSPIHAHDLENIAFTGSGIFDGNGDAWRPVKKDKMTESQWKRLLASGGVVSDDGRIWYPSSKSKAGADLNIGNVPGTIALEEYEAISDFLRPVLVSIKGCKRVLLDGPTFQNSPAWNIHPLASEDITIRNLTVRNPWYSQNGDGLDVESCRNVLVYDNTFDVGDDAICIKSGKDADGRRLGMPTENVVVRNNVVYHGHGGFVVGSEMSGGVRNVHVSGCTFIGTDIGLRFKSTRGRGGVVENIYISDINMIDIPGDPINFNLFYAGKSPVLNGDAEVENETEPMPVTEETPAFRNIFMKNIYGNGFGNAALFMGLPEMNLSNVHFENVRLRAKKGIVVIDTEGLTMKNVSVEVQTGAAITIYNAKNIDITDFAYNVAQPEAIVVAGSKNAKIRIKHVRKPTNADFLKLGSAVNPAEVVVD